MEKERKGKEFKKRLTETVERIHELTPESEEDRERLAELCVFSVRKFSEFSPMVALAIVSVAPDRNPAECGLNPTSSDKTALTYTTEGVLAE